MGAKKLEMLPDESFLFDALKDGRAVATELSMKALGKPDQTLQSRVGLNMDHVHKLSRILDTQGSLARIIVFQDPEDPSILRIANGFHRHEVYRRKRLDSIPAYVIQGGYRAGKGYHDVQPGPLSRKDQRGYPQGC